MEGLGKTIEELENSGVSAITIEDTSLPLTYKETSQRLISLDEGKGKINAALNARKDPQLSIIARTSAVTISSLEEAIIREDSKFLYNLFSKTRLIRKRINK